VTRLTNDPSSNGAPNWSATGDTIAFTRTLCTPSCQDEIYTMPAGGGTATDITNNPTDDLDAVFSPANTQIAFKRGAPASGEIWTMGTTGSSPTQLTSNAAVDREPDWQPSITGALRPKSAAPTRVPLVPAYNACSAPNRTHGPPLGFDSCNPPTQASSNLTVGTPDANGAAANSIGWAYAGVVVGTPGPPTDSAVTMGMSLTDVRCNNLSVATCGSANLTGGADYTGELVFQAPLRITDRNNATGPGGGIDPATMTDYTLSFSVPCGATASTSVGATCSAPVTDLNFYIPGISPEGKRDVWELGQFKVLDGGSDGDADTADNSLFEIQGLFVP
jgi:hypothetical protein